MQNTYEESVILKEVTKTSAFSIHKYSNKKFLVWTIAEFPSGIPSNTMKHALVFLSLPETLSIANGVLNDTAQRFEVRKRNPSGLSKILKVEIQSNGCLVSIAEKVNEDIKYVATRLTIEKLKNAMENLVREC